VTDWLGELDTGWLDGRFLWLVSREAGLLVTLASLAIAFAIGAVHAVGPGHGKALIGAYLLGAQGRRRDAVALGGIVALMHTGSVLVLGLAMYLTQRMPVSEGLETVLRMVSACGVTILGAVLLNRQLRPMRQRRMTRELPAAQRALVLQSHDHPAHDHHGQGHHHDGHDHGTDHRGRDQHGHHGHSHQLPACVRPLSGAGLVALASAGGLLPSPSALLVLASAIAIGRTGFGLALVVAFSVGLATTLTLIGLTLVLGRRALQRRVHNHRSLRRIAELLPVAGASAVLLGGLMLAGSVLVQL
jgi:nickel/cobalt exporter